MVRAEGLAVLRGERLVFEGVELAVEPGGALLLTGANGSGKSTLLRVLAGLLPPVAGRLLWQGADALADLAGHARRVAYLGHQDAVKPALSVRGHLPAAEEAAHGALECMGLGPLAALPARFLSAGQRRRLAIARVTLVPGRLWLLDEPTLGLDDASVRRLATVLEAHRAAGGMVVAATHLALPMPGTAVLRLGG